MYKIIEESWKKRYIHNVIVHRFDIDHVHCLLLSWQILNAVKETMNIAATEKLTFNAS